MKGLDLKEISGDRITSTLRDVVEKRLGSKDVDICIEAGSKKGNKIFTKIHQKIQFISLFIFVKNDWN